MNIAGYEFPDDLYYDKNHTWARVEGGVITQGYTEFAQKLAKEIQYVEIPSAGRAVTQGEAVLSIESGKWVGRMLAMVGGKVTAVNEELEFAPTLINESPYDQGWVVKIEASNPAELTTLWRANDPAFAALITGDVAKYKL